MTELFAEPDLAGEPAVTARRSIGQLDRAIRVTTPNYDYHYLCTELRRKRMIPLVTTIRAKSLEEFGDLVRHPGEEYIYVLKGRVEVCTEFYDPLTLDEGESIYIDSSMGHAFLAGAGCDEAVTIAVCSSADEDLMTSLLNLHALEQSGTAAPPVPANEGGERPARQLSEAAATAAGSAHGKVLR